MAKAKYDRVKLEERINIDAKLLLGLLPILPPRFMFIEPTPVSKDDCDVNG